MTSSKRASPAATLLTDPLRGATMTQTIEAVYEQGVFKPLERVKLKDGEKVKLSIEQKQQKLATDEMLRLAQKVYEGLSEQDIAEIEAIALDRSNFGRITGLTLDCWTRP